MKIFHVIIDLDIGGAELALKRLVEADGNNQYNQHFVVSLTSLGKVGQQLQSTGVHVHALGLRGPLGIPVVVWKLICLLRSERPNIVQTWMYHADLIGGLAARLAGVKNVIWNIRNTLIPQGTWSRSQLVVRLCAKLSHWVPRRIVCCAEAARSIHVVMGYAAEKMIVIPNGYDLSVFCFTPGHKQQMREQLGFSKDVIVIGTVGRFDPLKDYQNFVSAATRVGTVRPQVRFVMVGRGVDASNAQLRDWLASTGFSDRFILLGERSDVAHLMAALDIYCLASRAEGFPNVVAEAMSLQVPCVVTNVGDAALIVKDTGKVVPPDDSTALADALIGMIDLTHEQRVILGKRARRVIEGSYSIEMVAQQYKNLYSSLLL